MARIPLATRPAGFANAWSAFQTMTKAEIAQLLNEAQLAGTLKDLYADLSRVVIPPSSEEVTRMEQALRWPAQYLGNDRDLAMIVTGWADGCLRRDTDGATPMLVTEGLSVISRGLVRDGVRPQ